MQIIYTRSRSIYLSLSLYKKSVFFLVCFFSCIFQCFVLNYLFYVDVVVFSCCLFWFEQKKAKRYQKTVLSGFWPLFYAKHILLPKIDNFCFSFDVTNFSLLFFCFWSVGVCVFLLRFTLLFFVFKLKVNKILSFLFQMDPFKNFKRNHCHLIWEIAFSFLTVNENGIKN